MTTEPIKPCSDDEAFIPAEQSLPEITVKAVILSIILTVVLAAANAYLGLKVGITVSASIPAAVISMAVLGLFKRSNILENNIVQTAASCGEALTAVMAFTMPALIVIRYWQGFDYWETAFIAILGGCMGVFLSVPLRRVLLADKSLKFPEGTAIGNILKAKAMRGSATKDLIAGGALGGIISLCQGGFKLLSDSIQIWFGAGKTVFGAGIGFAPALIGAGYIIGINVALTIIVGLVIGWIIGVPVLALIYGIPHADSATDMAMSLWGEHIRYIGLGVMMVGGLWAICGLLKPMYRGIEASIKSLKQTGEEGAFQSIPRTERDMPITMVLLGILVLLIPSCILIHYLSGYVFGAAVLLHWTFSGTALILCFIGSIIFSAICGYFAGLVGSSTSPISSMALLALFACAFTILLFMSNQIDLTSHSARATAAAGLSILLTALISAAAVISNDTIQDLKAGQMVGATPWKQQVMLLLGVCVAAFVIPYVLQLLFDAYGIAGVFPRSGMDKSQMLMAPQAGLMAAVVQGIFTNDVNWPMMLTGAVIAIIGLYVNHILFLKKQIRFSILALGLGIYLPMASSTPLVIGGILSYLTHRRMHQKTLNHTDRDSLILQSNQRGMLFASGLVAGAAVMGVLLAIPFAISGDSDILRLMPSNWTSVSTALGCAVTLAYCFWMQRRLTRIDTPMS